MTEHQFKVVSKFKPKGSQPEAIKQLTQGLNKGLRYQTLLGITGSGKTFSIAHVIANVQKPTLVMVHNKTLAAQLYEELKELFPENRVEYFVSYYDYYQPESYIPQKDQYIEKDAQINVKIDQMRLQATASLMTRKDTIVVASVSAIYGLGDPKTFKLLGFHLEEGQKITRKEIIKKFVRIQYERNDTDLAPGRFRVKGDSIDFIPAYSHEIIRVELFGDEIEKISELDENNYTTHLGYFYVQPAKHFIIPESSIQGALQDIRTLLNKEWPKLPLMEGHRLKKRTLYDLEMIEETGYCKGIENYSRHFEKRKQGERPYTLLDYFGNDFLLILDESHQTIPQINGMYKGDRARKKNLIEYGFRLSSAYDNRPLMFDEFENIMNQNQTIFVSATPGPYEEKHTKQIVEQIIRPTGLLDPEVTLHPTKGQMDHLLEQIKQTIEKKNRVLVTTLTKRMAEELSDFLAIKGIKTRYLHSEIDTLERTEIIRELRLGKFDCLVGINLLREGLDIPEVGFVGILDADKEGFLRNERSLIQTIGRAARNVDSRVVLYADVETEAIRNAMQETQRRRDIQMAFNKEHHIVPQQIVKPIKNKEVEIKDIKHVPKSDIPNLIIELEADMKEAAEKMEFEKAIALRERIRKMREKV